MENLTETFRFMTGDQTLEYLVSREFTREQTMKAMANEKSWKARPMVMRAFTDYLKLIDVERSEDDEEIEEHGSSRNPTTDPAGELDEVTYPASSGERSTSTRAARRAEDVRRAAKRFGRRDTTGT